MSKRQWISDLLELVKVRIVTLSLAMATLGFVLGSKGSVAPGKLFATLLGLALIGAGCGALNEYLERDIDALMIRTRNRPLPTGRITPKTALLLGIIAAGLGEIVLLFFANPITAVLGALTLFFYLGIYTPSKRVSSTSTLIGAIPGALPPLMGWTAAYGKIAGQGMLLFAILFLWQIPHFLAIAWIYREDYARAGLPMLSVIDEEGIAVAKQVLIYSSVLLPLTLVPSLWGVTGEYYFFGALLLGAFFLMAGIAMALFRSTLHARRLFLVSIVYLPLLGILMAWDRL